MTLTRKPAELVHEAESSGSPGLLAKHRTWARVSLGDVAEVVNGCAFSSTYFNGRNDGLPLVRIRDVGVNSPSTFYDGPFSDRYLVHRGDALVGMDGDFRVSEWHGPVSLLNQRVCRLDIRDPDFYDKRFLVLILQGYLDAIWSATSSITVKHLSSLSVQEIPLPLPPLAEQRRIVVALDGHLSHLEAAEESLRLSLRRAENLGSSVVDMAVAGNLTEEKLFDGNAADLLREITEEWRSSCRGGKPPRLPVCEQTLIVPGRWVIASVDQLARRVQYGTSAKTSVEKKTTSLPVVRMGNIQNGHLTLDNLKYLPADHPDLHDRVLEHGDLLFNRTNSAELVGKSAVYQHGLARATFASYLIRCQFRQGIVPEWVNIVINSKIGRRVVQSVASQQVGQANVSGTKLRQMPIPLPPTAEQLRIVKRVSETSSFVERVKAQVAAVLRQSQRLRRALLADAFSGHLVPQDPNDESASVLLERISAERAVRPKAKRGRRVTKNVEQGSML